jgi:hypothetical protein
MDVKFQIPDEDAVKLPDMIVTGVQPGFVNSLGEPGFITSWGGAVTIFTPGNTTQQPGWSYSTGYVGPPDLFLSAPEFYLEPDFLIGGIYGIARGITKGCIVGLGFKGLKRAASKEAAETLARSGPIARSVGAMSRAEQLARKLKLNVNSPTTRQVLNSLDDKVSSFVGLFRKGSIKGRLPSEVMDMTVQDALKHSSTVRKLLIDKRFVK